MKTVSEPIIRAEAFSPTYEGKGSTWLGTKTIRPRAILRSQYISSVRVFFKKKSSYGNLGAVVRARQPCEQIKKRTGSRDY
jgi:hypothetical protein